MDKDSALHLLLGELSADMKHVLRRLEDNGRATDRLRAEVHEDAEKMDVRLSKVEKFQTKAMVVLAILAPIAAAFVKWGVPALIALV